MNIALLLSGGVDSSVALALLHEQGHNINAYYLKIWLEDELSYLGDCPWQEDLNYAQAVCDMFNVPLTVVPLQAAYKEHILNYTITEIAAGRTPNPDVLCNPIIKFGAFKEYLEKAGIHYDKIATGHYAGIVEKENHFYLHQVPDAIKDQTYFLARLSQEQLRKAHFPLNKYTKQEIRELAQKFNLPTKTRKDSQGLCFLGKIPFKEFIKHHIGTKIGNLIEYETGKKLGTHEGFWFYTIGQRQGIGLSHGPWYVVSKDPATNTVFISNTYHAEEKKRTTFFVRNCNWVVSTLPEESIHVKLRHGAFLAECVVKKHDTDVYHVALSSSDQGIAAGQFAVFYNNNLVIGSGVITYE